MTMNWSCKIFTVFFCIVRVLSSGQRTAMAAAGSNPSQTERVVRVGVVLDPNSTVGNVALSYIHAALSDFYKAHPTYQTRLSLHFRNPGNDVVAAASAGIG